MLLFINYIYSYTFEFFCQVLHGIWVLEYSNNNDKNNNDNNNNKKKKLCFMKLIQ